MTFERFVTKWLFAYATKWHARKEPHFAKWMLLTTELDYKYISLSYMLYIISHEITLFLLLGSLSELIDLTGCCREIFLLNAIVDDFSINFNHILEKISINHNLVNFLIQFFGDFLQLIKYYSPMNVNISFIKS